MMKTVMIPTDLSFGIENLMQTGLEFARGLHARLILLFIIEPMSTVTATPPYAFYESNKKLIREEKEKALGLYSRLIDQYRDQLEDESMFELIIENGDRVSSIIATADKKNPDVLVLPGEQEGMLAKILGETNNRIIQEVKVPVCIVPTQMLFSGFEKIAFLVEYEEENFKVIELVAELVKALGAKFYVLHPGEPGNFKSQLLFEGFKKEVAGYGFGVEAHHIPIDESDPIARIAGLIRDQRLDMLVMVKPNVNVLQQWFTSTTKEKLLDKLNVPVLVYPS